MTNPPFSPDELDQEIEQSESSFRAILRGAAQAPTQNDMQRLYEGAAAIAAVLQELRYQREKLSC